MTKHLLVNVNLMHVYTQAVPGLIINRLKQLTNPFTALLVFVHSTPGYHYKKE